MVRSQFPMLTARLVHPEDGGLRQVRTGNALCLRNIAAGLPVWALAVEECRDELGVLGVRRRAIATVDPRNSPKIVVTDRQFLKQIKPLSVVSGCGNMSAKEVQ